MNFFELAREKLGKVDKKNAVAKAGMGVALLVGNAVAVDAVVGLNQRVNDLENQAAQAQEVQDFDQYTTCRVFLSQNPYTTEEEDDTTCKEYVQTRRQRLFGK